MQYQNKKQHLNKKIGAVIKNLRVENTGLSLNQLANAYDIDKGSLSKTENGIVDCRISNLWKISEALGIKCSEVIKIVEEKLGEDFTFIDE